MKYFLLSILVCAVATLTGCVTPRPVMPALSQSDIIAMTKAKLTDEEIIRRIEDTRTVFRLGADDVVALRKEGVSGRVVNFMLDTYVRHAVREQRRQDLWDYDWHYRFGYRWYGHPWHCW